ncbi:MAG: SpvB/TcaC N-terminal domain-containing protein [Candidatus Nitrosopolaris sp.]
MGRSREYARSFPLTRLPALSQSAFPSSLHRVDGTFIPSYLSLSAGNGNGPFGLGWNVSIPSITRKTEKGIPRYDDPNESDVFILSGAEDLVPLLETSAKLATRITQYHHSGYDPDFSNVSVVFYPRKLNSSYQLPFIF